MFYAPILHPRYGRNIYVFIIGLNVKVAQLAMNAFIELIYLSRTENTEIVNNTRFTAYFSVRGRSRSLF
jgi:hypothetical protein